MKNMLLMVSLIFLFSVFSYAGNDGEYDAKNEARLLRFPAVYENRVVFSYAGDLYTVDLRSKERVARKLTSHSGYEMFPRFSGDGKWLAFTGQYDGNTEVYLMPADGGSPKRLTYTASLQRDDVADRMGPNNIVMGWKHDNKHILFRSRMYETDPLRGRLFLTTVDGDLHRQLALSRGGFCSFSPDDSKLAYNLICREFRTWKRYRGGQADDIRIYDFNTQKSINITNHPAQDIIPMWFENKIFFLSDRGQLGRMNLYAYNTDSGETKRLTDFKEYDIKFPSLGKESIAFENGGYIYLFNCKTGKQEKLEIFIREDRRKARGGLVKVKTYITGKDISPDGNRALFVARGDIFTVPAKYGNTRNLTASPGVHERNARWSPDGRWIAFISGRNGEDEIYIMPAAPPVEKPKPLRLTTAKTTGDVTYRFDLKWSPDSKKILWSDRRLRLRFVDIDTKRVTEVARADSWPTNYMSMEPFHIRYYDWSPDSGRIAYSVVEAAGLSKIYLYTLRTGKILPVTGDWYSALQPVFSACGKYLYFVSTRDFNPQLGEMGLNFIFRDMARIYMVLLSGATPPPFLPKSDEVMHPGSPAKVSPAAYGTAPPVKVDPVGLNKRILGLPVKPSGYSNLASVGNRLYYLRKGSTDKQAQMMMFDIEKQEEISIGECDGFRVSADRKKMLVFKGGSYSVNRLPTTKPVKSLLGEPLNLEHMEVQLDLKREWKNIFHACWRRMRDFFYLENMHGVDWRKMRERYEPLLPHVNHRNDLTYIIGEMIGELNAGHAYVGGGERPVPEKIETGHLGAFLERDPKTGYYRIAGILEGENWNNDLLSPLEAVGVEARAGDYIIAVDGKSTAGMKNIYTALHNSVGKQVRLTLNSVASAKGGREEVVIPIGGESRLVYHNWVQKNIETVSKATGGKVGYIHLPDMMEEGLSEFVKRYFPQLRKKALIIDARGNGGGYVSEWIIERLRRELLAFDKGRNLASYVNPLGIMAGPKVCIIDEYASSDGDYFCYRFKAHKIGKLIGKRTWGGAITIFEAQPLLDGGYLYKPEAASYDLSGKSWLIEGRGVSPDIEVDNDPAEEFAGIDSQLNRAIEVILEELKTKEIQIPPPPPDPNKSKTSWKW